jgi:glycosyltransferase involved in cell wall biosynthesis
MSYKIAIFIPSMEAGGAERVAISLTKGILHFGIKVDLVLVSAKGPLMEHIPAGVHVINLEADRTLGSLLRLRNYLKREKPDALISLLNHANVVAVIAGRLARFEGHIMLTEHNSIQFDLVHRKGLKSRIMLALMRYFYKYADSVVAVSNEILKELRTLFALKNAVCIYNPVDIPLIYTQNAGTISQDASGSDSIKTIVAIGRLSPQKNFSLLINSFKLISDSMHGKLYILGEGTERPFLEKIIDDLSLHDRVMLTGYVDNPFLWLNKADLFVLSSSWEGFALVIIEALAAGVTVVATDCHAGPAELLDHGKYGYLVPINNPEKMAEAILYALENPIDSELLRKRAEEFSIPKITEEYFKVIFGKTWSVLSNTKNNQAIE